MYVFHNSKVDGTPDQEITSGQVNAVLSSVTTAERVAGDTETAKIWITSDSDNTSYFGQMNPSAYSFCTFLSASDDDTEGDLTGSETKFGAMQVVSTTVSAITVKENTDYTLARVGDTLYVAAAPYEIDTITDNGDGTLDISATIDFVTLPIADEWVTTMFTISLVTATAKPFWVQRKIAAGSTWSGGTISMTQKIGH